QIVLACGAEPVALNVAGEEHLVDNEGFLSLASMPRRVVFVGGGYIAAEFSNIASLAGAEVTILQSGERMLEAFDADLVGWLMEKFVTFGIDVRTGTSVVAVEKIGGGYRVSARQGGMMTSVDADLVVHAAGRAPPLAQLRLEVAGIEVNKGKLVLNEFLQSVSNPAVYAAGDAAGKGPPLTPVASHDAEVVAANLLQGNHTKPDYRGVPSVVFSLPPIASVGLTEAEARGQGLQFHITCQKAGTWFTARQAAEPVYGFKVMIEKKTGRVLGAHLVGPHVDDNINLFALAIRHGITADALKATMFAYPTSASDIGHML
ncbi:MAG: NAD(P)/FAD-dependent oxidoreductase, partial [Pseudomonadota bacterium]|nr:NAD(P)/FAD-dependent oxidoreductase [Pseudomonadota bacterium]